MANNDEHLEAHVEVAEALIELADNPDNLDACQDIAAALIELCGNNFISFIELNEYILHKMDLQEKPGDTFTKQQLEDTRQELEKQISEVKDQLQESD